MTRRSILLEVERKFSHLRTYPLTQNAGIPPFRSLDYLGRKQFRDVYFDHERRLSQGGLWVRRRDGKWQSKIKQGGTYKNSQFREIEDPAEISKLVKNLVGRTDTEHASFGLSPIADFTTEREEWRADKKFQIVYDTTDFARVGEVELEKTVTVESDAELTQHTEAMDAQISDFLNRYQWAFDCNNPVGKLTAYFARQSQLPGG